MLDLRSLRSRTYARSAAGHNVERLPHRSLRGGERAEGAQACPPTTLIQLTPSNCRHTQLSSSRQR